MLHYLTFGLIVNISFLMILFGFGIIEVVNLFEREANLKSMKALSSHGATIGIENVINIPKLIIASNDHSVANKLRCRLDTAVSGRRH
jgi:hypothetical protein